MKYLYLALVSSMLSITGFAATKTTTMQSNATVTMTVTLVY